MSEHQTTLFDAPQKPTDSERFKKFMEAHPWFVPDMIREAREWKDGGAGYFSVKGGFERRRHLFRRSENTPAGKVGLNNTYTSYCAREMLRIAPDLADVIQVRN